ncbi:MAG: MBL fold metallo-hydrolase [Christensenellaceae bacterium]|jgi:ribonuclease BN (tRNA processing enzyme)|nr:MBL fold metallo-hydrolase [Christensenellaceae bacterium]
MNLTVIGKYGPYATPTGGACSCYLVEGTDYKFIMDLGAGTLGKLRAKVNIEDVDFIYITHLHYDHTSDLLTLRYLLEDKKKRLKIYAPLNETPWSKILFTHPLFDVTDTSTLNSIEVKTKGGATLKAELIPTIHPVFNLGIKISDGEKTLAYTGDTDYCDAVIKLLSGADLAVCDCSKPTGFKSAHCTESGALKLYAQTHTPIIASHQNEDYDPAAFFAANNPNIVSAIEGKTYHL